MIAHITAKRRIQLSGVESNHRPQIMGLQV